MLLKPWICDAYPFERSLPACRGMEGVPAKSTRQSVQSANDRLREKLMDQQQYRDLIQVMNKQVGELHGTEELTNKYYISVTFELFSWFTLNH